MRRLNSLYCITLLAVFCIIIYVFSVIFVTRTFSSHTNQSKSTIAIKLRRDGNSDPFKRSPSVSFSEKMLSDKRHRNHKLNKRKPLNENELPLEVQDEISIFKKKQLESFTKTMDNKNNNVGVQENASKFNDENSSIESSKQQIMKTYSVHPICKENRCVTHSSLPFLDFKVNPKIPIFKPSLKQFDPSKPIKPVITYNDGNVDTVYTYSYPSFVLPSPLNVEPHKISSYFMNTGFLNDELSRTVSQCSYDDVYMNREKSINYYNSYNCKENPGLCGPLNSYISYCMRQYKEGRVWIIHNGYLPSCSIDCGWNSPYTPQTKDKHTPTMMNGSFRNNDVLPGKYVYLPIPDGWSFQHFVDGVLPKLTQMEVLLNNKDYKYIVELNQRFPIVVKLFERLGISRDRLIPSHQVRSQFFEYLIFPCFTPPIHPYLWQRAQYLLKLPHTVQKNLPQPMKVAYLSRGSGSFNSGRRVINEQYIIENLKKYFENTNYEVVIFKASDYPELDQLFEFWSTVKFVIGPHGGSFSNVIFMRPETVLIEFQFDVLPLLTSAYNYRFMFYLQATMLGLGYHSVLCNADNVGSSANFLCDFDYISDILDVYMEYK